MELTKIKGVGPKRAEEFNKLGIHSAQQLVEYVPYAYKDLTSPAKTINVGEFVLLKGTCKKVSTITMRGRKLVKTTAQFCGDVNFNAVWWNMPYIAASVKAGQVYLVFGKATKENELVNPKIENELNNVRLKGTVPVYKKTSGLNQNFIRDSIAAALELPLEMDAALIEPNALDVYRKMHFPATVEEGEEARSRVKSWQLAFLSVAHSLTATAIQRRYNPVDMQPYYDALPFRLTSSQEGVLDLIKADMTHRLAGRRIIVGDTGSGKSAVAYGAMYFAVKNGYKAAIMSPTEILSRQHFDNLTKLGFRALCVTGTTLNAEMKRKINAGDFDVLSGTESLLNKHLNLTDLGIVVIDEQHRFGVADRGALERRHDAYSLSLSATPIPRTQMLGLFGLKFSPLAPLYQNENRKTYVIHKDKLDAFWKYVSDNETKSVFCVCPRIEDEEGDEMYSAKSLFDECVKRGVCDGKIGLLHGAMSGAKKAEAMQDFAEGKTRLLISTTVVEVGIDVPHANTMLVMNADRFSVATLHQLRGRIGRDGRESQCYFHTDTASPDTLARILYVASVSDGGKLSEFDYARRGGGEVFGLKQSGKTAGYTAHEIALADGYARALKQDETRLKKFRDQELLGLAETLKDLTLS